MKGLFHQPHEIMVDEAIEFIKANEPPEGYCLSDSGGKDSAVLRHLAILSKVKFQAYYYCTGIDPPELVRFLKEHHQNTTFLYPKKSYWKGIITGIPPTIQARWCCDTLKKEPSKKIPLKHRLLGIRFEESMKRARRGRITKMGKQHHYYPIYAWSEYHIWEHIERHNLPYCQLYDEGWSRISCLCCPFSYITEHRRNIAKYPSIYQLFDRLVKRRWNEFKQAGKLMYNSSAEEYLIDWYANRPILFYKENKNKGLNLIRED